MSYPSAPPPPYAPPVQQPGFAPYPPQQPGNPQYPAAIQPMPQPYPAVSQPPPQQYPYGQGAGGYSQPSTTIVYAQPQQ